MATNFIFDYVITDPDEKYNNQNPKVIAINIQNKSAVILITYLNTCILEPENDEEFDYSEGDTYYIEDNIYYILDNIKIPFIYFDIGIRNTANITKSFYLELGFDKKEFNKNKKYIVDLLSDLHDKFTTGEYYCNWKKDCNDLVDYIRKYNSLPTKKYRKEL